MSEESVFKSFLASIFEELSEEDKGLIGEKLKKAVLMKKMLELRLKYNGFKEKKDSLKFAEDVSFEERLRLFEATFIDEFGSKLYAALEIWFPEIWQEEGKPHVKNAAVIHFIIGESGASFLAACHKGALKQLQEMLNGIIDTALEESKSDEINQAQEESQNYVKH